MSNGNHVVWSDLRGDGNVAGEVEIHWQRDELEKWHQVVRCDQWNVKNEYECFLVQLVDVGRFGEEEIRRLVDERKHVAVCGDFVDVANDFQEGIKLQGSW